MRIFFLECFGAGTGKRWSHKGELKRELDAHAQGRKVGQKEPRISRGPGPRCGSAGCLLATSLLNNKQFNIYYY